MALTYVPAATRDVRRAKTNAWRLDTGPLVVAAVSLAAVILTAAVYAGRTAVVARAGASVPVNLNAVVDATALEGALAGAFDHPADRRFAARELFGYLVQTNGRRRILPNVGSLTRVEVPVAAIEREPQLVSYAERLTAAKARAASTGPALQTLPLFTSADVALVKPALAVRGSGDFRRTLLLWAALSIFAFHVVWLVWRVQLARGDYVLLAAAHLLVAIGFAAMVARADPLRDTMLFVRYAQGVVVGACLMAAVSLVPLRRTGLSAFSLIPLAAACGLSVLLIVFGSGPAGSNAKVNLGPVQPIEAIRVLLALFLAGYFARHWELLRSVRGAALRGREIPRWMNAPSLEYVLPVIAGVGTALALFFFQRDLGPALIIAVLFLTMYVVARAKVLMALGGAALLAAGFYLGYKLRISATLAERVRMWQSPWDNAARGGDQVAQALWAMSTGGTSGTGLGLGDTRYLPAGHTDLVLAAIGEELGIIGLVVAAIAFATLVWRGFQTARRAGTDYGFFLALALTLMIALPVLLMAGGIIGLVPLTGVVTPFLSYGGSAMVANFGALGALASIRSSREAAADLEPFRKPVRWVTSVLAGLAVVIGAAVVRVQVVQADDVLVRAHLGIQGDGTQRYQYNPRVLDVARQIPRGNVVDRRGLPLATEDPALVRRARADYQRLNVVVDESCGHANERCYPLGGRTYHLLGDARTRADWTASNTSFVERDRESKLRGFDDHETAVRTIDASGGPAWTVRRDYRELIPLVRHRYNPEHPSVRAIVARPRDVRLTIDAALQVRTAAIVAEYSRRSTSGRAAAVVIDPQSGDLLASVSYPWPSEQEEGFPAGPEMRESALDRARYGLYPPGSTFKLVTAAAALRQDKNAHRAQFVCSRLPDGRVGAKISGWGRPVRDDQLDRRAHGRIDMHRAMVVSCNAYFAQLAVRLGPEALLEAARPVDVSLARDNVPARVRDALPQVGYGQAEVVATPLRMARIAAAIADGGRVRDVRWELDKPVAAPEPFMTPDTARLLATYMRNVVLNGTGRAIRNSPQPIAGKTGTAEIAGSRSHSWFVGFAPYGPASRRVAVAVIVENAGYGAASAAPAAAEIVAAAASLGLVR